MLSFYYTISNLEALRYYKMFSNNFAKMTILSVCVLKEFAFPSTETFTVCSLSCDSFYFCVSGMSPACLSDLLFYFIKLSFFRACNKKGSSVGPYNLHCFF